MKLRKTGTRIPVVLSEPETQGVFGQLESSPGGERYELAARLQYGAGLRRSELVRLRVKDVDPERGILTVRQGKGGMDRNTTEIYLHVAMGGGKLSRCGSGTM